MKDNISLRATLETMPAVAATVLRYVETMETGGAVVLALSGDLGAGKTTFVQTLARQLGITDTVNSPTFTIMKQYETTHVQFEYLVHMDAYRIDDVSELVPLRWESLVLLPQTLICVEWPEKITSALPKHYIHASLKTLSETEREITITIL